MLTVNTPREAYALLERAVQERGPDYKYPERETSYPVCAYWHREENAPGCIVGLALARAGVSPRELQAFDMSEGIEGSTVSSLHAAGQLPGFSPEAVLVFERAQGCQDLGYTWGEALEQARQEAIKLDPRMGDIGEPLRHIEIVPVPEPNEAPVHEPAAPAPAEQPVPA